jgi:hypothetical protein
MTIQYVYGVTFADTSVPGDLRGMDFAPVSLVTRGRCGALVSDLAGRRPLGTQLDLLAHERVLERLAKENVSVLPFRFGAAMSGPEEIATELLTAHEDRFLRDLGRMVGRVELVVKGGYVDQEVYREVLNEVPEVTRLRERIRGLPEKDARDERIRIGELVARALAGKREDDGQRLIRALSPYAAEVAPRRPTGEDGAVNAAFLVERERRAEFDLAVDRLGREWEGRVRLRLIGPLPPYDFVGGTDPEQAAA